MSAELDRRGFLKSAAALMGSLSLPSFAMNAAAGAGAGTPAVPLYTSWQDVYRSQWSWDKVVRSTHHLNCWFQAHCSWDVYVKDGLVYREEQAGVSNISQTSMCKYYHGNLSERSMALIFALTGNIGRRGAGFSGFPLLTPDGGDKFAIPPSLKEAAQTFGKLDPLIQQRLETGDSQEMIVTDLGRMMFVPGNKLIRLPVWTSGTLFWSVHGGVGELSKRADEWQLGNKRPLSNYLDEALASSGNRSIRRPILRRGS